MAAELDRIDRLVRGLAGRERRLLALRIALSVAALAGVVLILGAFAATRELDGSVAATAVVLVGGIGGWWLLGLPLVTSWPAAGDGRRQALLLEALRPDLRGRLVASVERVHGIPAGESPAIVRRMAAVALRRVGAATPEMVHAGRDVQKTGLAAAVAWVVALAMVSAAPGGARGVMTWWFGASEALAAVETIDAESAAELAKVGDLVLRYVYPEYTGLEPYEVVNSTGEASAPPGTTVEVVARSAESVEAASLIAYDEPALDAEIRDDRTIKASFTVQTEPGVYRLVTYRAGQAQNSRPFAIQPEPDLPPDVVLSTDKDLIEVPVNEPFRLGWHARDDYGVKRVVLEVDGKEQPNNLRYVRERQADVADDLVRRPSELGMTPGGMYELVVAAWDNDTFSGSKAGRSEVIRIAVLGPEGFERLTIERREEILDVMVGLLGDHLEEPYPPGPSSGDYARWGELLAARYTPLTEFMQDFEGSRQLDTAEWQLVQAALDDARSLIRYTQVTFLPNATAFAPPPSVEAVDGLREGAIEGLEEAIIAVDRALRGESYQTFRREADMLADDALRLEQQLSGEEIVAQEALAELEALEVRVGRLHEAAERLQEGGIREYVEMRADETQRLIDEIRAAFERLDAADARELMKRLASHVGDMAVGIRDELERRVERGREAQQRADQLLEALKQLESDQNAIREKVSEIRDAGDERLSQRLEKHWEEIARAARELRASTESFSTQIESVGRHFDELEHGRWADEEARGLLDAVAARDLSGAEMATDGISRAWRSYRRRFESRYRGGEPTTGPGTAVVQKIQGQIEAMYDLLDRVRRVDNQGDPEVRDRVQSLDEEQRQLERRLEQVAEDAHRLAQEYPVTPRGMEEALEQAGKRMGDATSQLERGQAMQAEGSQGAASMHVREAIESLEQAKNEGQQQQQRMEQGGSKKKGDEEQEGGEENGNSGDSDEAEGFELPEPEEFRTPEAYRRELLRGMEGDVPDAYRSLKRRYYEELVHQ